MGKGLAKTFSTDPKIYYNQVIIPVYVSEYVTVCVTQNSHHHTKYSFNKAEVGILGNPHLLQFQSQQLILNLPSTLF